MTHQQTVSEYIDSTPDNAKQRLQALRQIITRLAPEAEERMSYAMLGYFYNGALVYIGAFKNHVSLFGAGTTLMSQFASDLKDYKTSKGTIQFPLDKPLPTQLIKKLVQARLEENLAKKKP